MILRIGAIFLLLLATACSSSDQVEPEAVEIPTTSTPLDDSPEAELFARAKALYARGLFIVARDAFESLRDAYPLGPYTEFAEIKLADCDFELNRFLEAGLQYEELLKNRPSSQARPYLLLMAGRSYQLANRGIGRDSEPLQKASSFFEQLEQEFPGSMYREALGQYQREVKTLLARSEAEILDFYERQNKMAAYEARLEAFEEKWGATDLEQVAARLKEYSSPSPEELSVSESLSPPGVVYTGRETFALHQPSPVERVSPATNPADSTSQEARASLKRSMSPSENIPAEASQGIRSVDCEETGSGELISVQLFRFPGGLSSAEILPQQGIFTVQLDESAKNNDFECSAGRVVSINKNGELYISARPGEKASVFALNNPARVMALIEKSVEE